jgi:hypothetical protein
LVAGIIAVERHAEHFLAPLPVTVPGVLVFRGGRAPYAIDYDGGNHGPTSFVEPKCVEACLSWDFAPDGRAGRLGTEFRTDDGMALPPLVRSDDQAPTTFAAWADDSRHLCAVTQDPSALELAVSGSPRRPLSAPTGATGEPKILSCSITNDRVIVAFDTHDVTNAVGVYRISSAELMKALSYPAAVSNREVMRTVPPGAVRVMASPDATVLAEITVGYAPTVGSQLVGPTDLRWLDSDERGHVEGAVTLMSWHGDRVVTALGEPLDNGVLGHAFTRVANAHTGEIVWTAGKEMLPVKPRPGTDDLVYGTDGGGDVVLVTANGRIRKLVGDATASR